MQRKESFLHCGKGQGEPKLEFLNDFITKMDYVGVLMPVMLQGLWMTTKLFIWTLVLSIPLGLVFTLGTIGRIPPIRWICKAYIFVFRGTPLLLQLFFFYFFLPISFNIQLPVFTTAVLTFVLNYAAYLAEIYRGGIQSIERGQYEAAYSLGLSHSRTMFKIIIPQTVSRVLPAVTNEAIILVKDTALVSAIGVAELLKVAKQSVSRDVDTTAFLIAAVMYLVFTFVLTLLSSYLEKKFSKHQQRVRG